MVRGRVTAAAWILVALAASIAFLLQQSWSWYRQAELIVTVIALFLYVFSRYKVDLEATSIGKPLTVPVSYEEILTSSAQVDRNYEVTAIEYLVRVLLDLPRHLSRVSEEMELDGRNILSKTTQVFTDLRIRENGTKGGATVEGGIVLVPLVLARKGRLLDRFTPRTADGKVISTLSQWETRGVIWVVVRTVLERAIVAGDSKLDDKELLKLLKILCFTAFRSGPLDTAAKNMWHRSIAELKGFRADRFDPVWLDKAAAICETLVENFLLVVEVEKPSTNSILLSYETLNVTSQFNKRPYELLRARHGLRPYSVDVPMTRITQADSFHFQFLAPAGSYVFNHHLEELRTNRTVKQEQCLLLGVQQYVRVYHERGQSLAHLYYRRQRQSEPKHRDANRKRLPKKDLGEVKSIISFREIPPGALGNAATIALVTTLILLYFTVFRVGLDGSLDKEGANTNQDIPAFILTVPAFLAAVLGRSIDANSLSMAPLTAFYGLWISMCAAMFGVGLYLYGASRSMLWDVHLVVLGHAQNYNMIWIVASLVSLLNYLFLRKEKSERRRYYLGILQKSQSRPTV